MSRTLQLGDRSVAAQFGLILLQTTGRAMRGNDQGRTAVAKDTLPRRKFLLGAGLAGTAVATGLNPPPAEAQTPAAAPPAPQANEPVVYLTLNAAEAAFMSAVADTMIPADNLSPSGTDCGVVV